MLVLVEKGNNSERIWVKCDALERVFHVSQQMISEYVKAGMPRPERKRYDLEACVTWWVDRQRAAMEKRLSELGREEQETRLKRVQAEKQELLVAQMRRELVPVAEIHEEYGRVVSAVRSKLLIMPGALAERVIACASPVEAQRIIDDAVRNILTELGTAGFIHSVPMAPAAAVDGEPVGRSKPRAVRRGKRRSRTVGHVKG